MNDIVRNTPDAASTQSANAGSPDQAIALLYTRFARVHRVALSVGAVGVGILWNQDYQAYLLAWLGLLVLCAGTGEVLAWRYWRQPQPIVAAARWGRYAVAYASCIGAVIGLAGGYALAIESAVQQNLLVCLAVIAVAAAVPVLAPLRSAVIVFSLCALVPVSLAPLLQPDAAHVGLSLALLTITALLIRFAIHYQGALARSSSLLEEQRTLQDRLNEASAHATDVQGRLQYEIQDRKSAEHDLVSARLAAEQATRIKSEFLATMSHEIRTPMNGVLGMSELLLGTELNNKQRRFADTIHRSGEALMVIINDILDFSRIDSGKYELQNNSFDLHQLIEDTMAGFAERAHHKGLELACMFREVNHVMYRGDPDRLRQVVSNLIGNGIKFTDRGEVVVRVKILKEWEKSARLRCEVTDTGIGIRAEQMERIFDSFSQADGAMNRRFGGTGLGLAISKRLIELMQGEIGVESQFGRGSTFWFELVLTKSYAAKLQSVTPMKDGLKGSRVLVVDDNATNREILEHQLSAWGSDYRLTKNAEEAMHALHEAVSWGQPFHLAILDKQMPGTDGIDLARAIKQDPKLKQLHLVMLSSVGSLDETGKWMAAGVEAYLNKPIRQAELYSALATVLGRVEKAAASAPAKAAAKQLPTLTGHILVVEDNLVNQELAQRMLNDFGCRVRIVANGLEAVEAICNSPLDRANDPYDLILMDCQMPEMDGFEATAKIREHERAEAKSRRLPIVALTANALAGDRENCIAAGMDDYLSKPFSKSQLFDIVQRWLPCTAVAATTAPAPPGVEAQPHTATKAKIDKVALDRIRGLQRDGQPDVLGKVVRLYLENSPKILAEIEAAVAAQDAGRLTQACTSLRSSSASLGLEDLTKVCRELLDVAGVGAFDRATVALSILQFEHAAACEALLQELDRPADKEVA